MKRLMILSTALMALASAVGCECNRCFQRSAPCAPACMPAPACAPAVSYGGDCAPSTTYSGGTIVEPYMGSPTPAGTTVTPAPSTYTPSPN